MPDGSQKYLGDLGIDRENPNVQWFHGGEGVDNETKPVGDPSIVWTIGGELKVYL
jgi:hypothetical protein